MNNTYDYFSLDKMKYLVGKIKDVIPTKVSELDNDEGYTDNIGTVTSVSAGAGLAGGPVTSSGSLKVKMKSELVGDLPAAAKTSTSNREYAVGLDSNGDLSVNIPWTDTNTYPSAYSNSAVDISAKTATCTDYQLVNNSYLHFDIATTNTYVGALTMNVNNTEAIPIYINGQPSSTTNCNLPRGSYIAYYNGTNFYFRTDGKLTGAGLVDINGNNDKYLRGDGTWQTITDTTYESLPAEQGGDDVSLVTTGEKYTWNNKSDFSGSYSDLSNKPDIGDIEDVDLSSIQDKQVLKWDSSTNKWINSDEDGTNLNSLSTSINDITDNDKIVIKQNSDSNWYQKTFTKVWDYVKNKIGIADSGSTFLRKDGTWVTPSNNKVEQEYTTDNNQYRVLLSNTADNITETEKVRKGNTFRVNPYNGNFYFEGSNSTSTTIPTSLLIGNNKGDGTIGATHGFIELAGKSTYLVDIYDKDNILTSNRELYLPNNSGYIATTSTLATDETGNTNASQNYAIKDHFIKNGEVCTITATVNSGDPLVKNTNYIVEDDFVSIIPTKVSELTNDSGFITVDENVKQITDNSNKNYRLLLSTNAKDDTETGGSHKTSGLIFNPGTGALYIRRVHENTATQPTYVHVGNGIADGSAGASYGQLRMYGKGEYSSQIYDKNNILSNDRELYLPNNNGIIATTNLITDDETGNTASSKQYLQGEHFIKDGKICTALNTINEDVTFVLNSNYKIENDLVSIIPINLADLNSDSTHRTVTDTEKETWNNKTSLNNKVTQENTTSSSHYRVILSHSSDDTDETDKVRKSGGLTYQASTGSLEVSNIHSETTAQMASVEIGNDTPNGTAGATYGRLRLYGKNDKKVNITVSDDISASRDLVLPNKSGTVALTSDLPAAQVNSDWNASSGVAEILNKPTIPTVNDATLTIQKNGTTVETFTANASSNKTANITVPTKVSDLTNDSGFVTTDNKVQQDTISTSTQYYRPLLSSTYGSYTTTDETNTVKKSDNLIFRPGNASNASWLQLKHIHSVSDADSLPSILSIGHAASTTSGSETGASHGALRIYGKNGYYVGISDNYGLVDNNNRGLYLANRQGIIPTTNLIATDESPLTDVSGTMKRVASKAYSIGDHFIINNYYCRATEAIAKNAELIKNSNYVEETDLVSTIPTKVSDLTNDSGFTTLTLGTTSTTAYRGDRGASAYAHAVTNKGSAFSSGLYKITTNSEGHVTAATAVEKADITALGIPGSDTDTHRPIQVNGTQVLGNNTTALNLAAGSNVTLSNSSGTVTIAATDTTYESKSASSGGTALSLVTTGEKYTWNNKITADTGWAYNVFGISRTTTKGEDESARITFRTYDNTDTQNILTNYSYIRAYSPHSGGGGNNLVINSTGRLYLGSGEFAQNLYSKHYNEADSSKALTGETMYIGSDTNMYLFCNANTISSRKYIYLGSNDTYGLRLTPGSVALNESSAEVITADNVGAIGLSTNRWAAGYFVGLTSTDLTITNINGVAVGSTPEFTDYKTQIGKSTANTNRLVMLSAAYDSSSETKTVSSLYYDSALTYNPSTDTLKGFKNLNTTSDDFYLNGTSTTTFKVCVTSDSTVSQMTGLLIGNSKNASAGCSHGVLQIYSRSDKYVRMYDRKIGSTNNDGVISANRNYYFPDKDGYLQVGYEFEATVTRSKEINSNPVEYTFTSSDITANSAIDVYYDIFGVNPLSVTTTSGSCVVTFPAVSGTHTCRIYVKP